MEKVSILVVWDPNDDLIRDGDALIDNPAIPMPDLSPQARIHGCLRYPLLPSMDDLAPSSTQTHMFNAFNDT